MTIFVIYTYIHISISLSLNIYIYPYLSLSKYIYLSIYLSLYIYINTHCYHTNTRLKFKPSVQVVPQAVSPKVPLSPRQVSCGPVARRHDRVAMSHVTGVSQIWPPKKTLWRTIHVASTVRSPRMVGALDSPGQDLPSSGRRDVT